jgi:uncharacterized cupredoxin-like copper-binding protein
VKKTLVVAVALLAAATTAFAFSRGSGERVVEVTIHHSHFAPSNLSFSAGSTVRFVIHNEDPIAHEFILGGRTVQYYMEHTAHPSHDGSVPGQISVPAGTTVTTTYTFASHPYGLLFGCHLPGHYKYGMRGVVTIT